MWEELLQGVKQGEQIHYSLGTKTCLRELARTGRSTCISSSLGVMWTSERVDKRVEQLRRPEEPGTVSAAWKGGWGGLVAQPSGSYTGWDGSWPPGKGKLDRLSTMTPNSFVHILQTGALLRTRISPTRASVLSKWRDLQPIWSNFWRARPNPAPTILQRSSHTSKQ